MSSSTNAVISQWLSKVLLPYSSRDRLSSEILSTLSSYPTLSVRTQAYTYDSGQTNLLVNLHGVLPITFRGVGYHIPLIIWFPLDYPRSAPIVYVDPTKEMGIRRSEEVEPGGRVVGGQVLRDWEAGKKWEAKSLRELVDWLRETFGERPPVYAKATTNASVVAPTTTEPPPSVVRPSVTIPQTRYQSPEPLPPYIPGATTTTQQPQPQPYPSHQRQQQPQPQQPPLFRPQPRSPPPPPIPCPPILSSGQSQDAAGASVLSSSSASSALPPPLPNSPLRTRTLPSQGSNIGGPAERALSMSTPPPPIVPAHPTPPLPPPVPAHPTPPPHLHLQPQPQPQPHPHPQQAQGSFTAPGTGNGTGHGYPREMPGKQSAYGPTAQQQHQHQHQHQHHYQRQSGIPYPSAASSPVQASTPPITQPRSAPKPPIQDLLSSDDSSDLESQGKPTVSGFTTPTSNSHGQFPSTTLIPPSKPLPPSVLHLHSLVHAHISSRLPALLSSLNQTTSQLLSVQADLATGEPAIKDEMARLEAVKSVCVGVTNRMGQVVKEAEERVVELERRGEPSVDEIVCSTSIVHNQLIDLVAEDNAIEDTIYHLARALDAERIDLDRFLKQIRTLAREQYTKRALIDKIQSEM